MAKPTNDPSPWEKFVYDKFSALAVPFWKGKRGLQLFDVLIIKSDDSVGATRGGQRPILQQVRNFFSLCALRGVKDDDDLARVDVLKEALKEFNKRRDDDDDDVGESEEEPIILREDLGTLKETVKADSNIVASLLEVIGFRRKSSKKVTITIEEGLIRYVDKQGASFSDAIDVWKADMTIIAKYAGVPSENSEHVDLYLITDVLCADNIIVEDNKSKSGGANVQMPGPVLAGALGMPPVASAQPLSVAEVSKESTSDMESALMSKETTFAIRTVRLRCSRATGEVMHIDTAGGLEVSVGKVRHSTDCKFLADPLRDRTYNMGDLFLPEDPEECSYVPLEISLDDTALESADQDEVSDLDSDD